jgi:hypothetical protein
MNSIDFWLIFVCIYCILLTATGIYAIYKANKMSKQISQMKINLDKDLDLNK